MLHTKFKEYRPIVSGEEDILAFLNICEHDSHEY